jgi:PiT family inorganic phosphate transporter
MIALLVLLAIGFAYSMGAHYTGACMGMPHALRAISTRNALLVMAPLTLAGAALASHGVENTVGNSLLTGAGLSAAGLVIVVGVAFGLTSLFNLARVPTSTIQILVFSVVGAGLAAGTGVHWATIGTLAVIWAAAPVVAGLLGYALTRALDLVPAIRVQAQVTGAVLAGVTAGDSPAGPGGNATPAPAGRGAAAAADARTAGGPLAAGLIGGAGLAAGVLTWGRPLLRKVAFDIVTVDRPMATAAQLVQAAVVLAAVGFGLFTSMNQALIGAMTGTAAARGRRTVHASALYGVLRGWLIGPGAAIALSYAISWLVAFSAGAHILLAAGRG